VNVSLNQAIEIHAKVLAHRFGDRAPLLAQEKAHHCSASGDNEGHAVWLPAHAEHDDLLVKVPALEESVHFRLRSSALSFDRFANDYAVSKQFAPEPSQAGAKASPARRKIQSARSDAPNAVKRASRSCSSGRA
jgi:hypothetical protein